ncbi:hypothetical protein [Arthrobacter sp. OAP107]|uniref:hypothetical protein n=1 Tax=Arthrobacter sp. OAP107 TaxID=3156445 RepID=UPI003399DEFF
MWPFRSKHVVHVDVALISTHPEKHRGTYKFSTDPVTSAPRKVEFLVRPFRYSNSARTKILGELTHLSKRDRKRTQIKLWRDNTACKRSETEYTTVRRLNRVLLLEILLILAAAIWYAVLPQADAEKIMPGASLASIAASAAFLLGNLVARNSKPAAPFEYTREQIRSFVIFVGGGVLLGVAVYAKLPELLLPDLPELKFLTDVAQRILAILSFITTVVGAAFSGAFDVAKWVIVEEFQRESKAARELVDALEPRKPV